MAGQQGEADVSEHHRIVEGERHIVEDDNRRIRLCAGRAGVCQSQTSLIEQRDQQTRDEKVHSNHRYRRCHDGIGSGATDALRSATVRRPT